MISKQQQNELAKFVLCTVRQAIMENFSMQKLLMNWMY